MARGRKNTERRFGEALNYIHVRINGGDALFTEGQIKVALDRAVRQPEDVPSRRPWWKFWRTR